MGNLVTNKIEAHEQDIARIFSDSYEFEIPPYQRPYAWETEQTRELLADLLDAMDNEDVSGGLYFLGSIVLVKLPTSAQSKVIDGQQRLTTLTILLSVLRDLTTDVERRFERREYVYQKANADRGLKERYRLLLRERDRSFFLQYIQGAGATDRLPDPRKLEGSQKLIAENALFLRVQLEETPENRRDALVQFILQRCYLVVVAVPTPETARRIFTVLNARGLDLTPTDILKADLLDRAGPDREDLLAARWEQIELTVGRERLVELFGHIRMIYERDKPRLDLESGFKKFVTPFSADPGEFVSEILEPVSDAFSRLSDFSRTKKHFGTEAEKAMRSLARVDNKDWAPPLLLRLWRCQGSDDSAVGKFIVDLERLTYFLFVTRAGVNERIARFAAVMDEFDRRPGRERPSVGVALTEAEQYGFFNVLSGPIYTTTRVCKPVLQRLDEALSSGGASYDELVSIEHVLPQTVDEGSEWATLFPDEQERSDWTHRLANLVFLTHRINTRASNWDFERKKREYFSSSDGSAPFVITQGVLRTDKWTPQHLHARQRDLLQKLCQVWRLDAVDLDDQIPEITEPGSSWIFTPQEIIVGKRNDVIHALGRREGVKLDGNGARFSSEDGAVRVVVAVSKRSTKRSDPYWYGFRPKWQEFLSQGTKSFLAFGCVDRDSAYVLPAQEFERILHTLHRTRDQHWHVSLDENENGGLDLVQANGTRLSLNRYELRLR